MSLSFSVLWALGLGRSLGSRNLNGLQIQTGSTRSNDSSRSTVKIDLLKDKAFFIELVFKWKDTNLLCRFHLVNHFFTIDNVNFKSDFLATFYRKMLNDKSVLYWISDGQVAHTYTRLSRYFIFDRQFDFFQQELSASASLPSELQLVSMLDSFILITLPLLFSSLMHDE